MRSELLRKGRWRTLAICVVIVRSVAAVYSHGRCFEARESELRAKLWTLNNVLHEYTFDQLKAPRTVADLFQEQYLSEVPVDPVTGSNSTWRIVPYRQKIYSLVAPDGKTITESEAWGVAVKSASTKVGLNGRPYSEW